jgi:hypothetical protein
MMFAEVLKRHSLYKDDKLTDEQIINLFMDSEKSKTKSPFSI